MQYLTTFAFFMLMSTLGHAADSPYAGQESRPIKALSQQDIEDLRSGRGMRTSLAAELNHYPGPRHVLEHAQPLGLSKEQQADTQRLHEAMARDASRLGEQIVQKEAQLEALFASGQASQENVRGMVHDIGTLQAEYRLVHLGAHLSMRQVLSPAQIASYDKLRGYGGTNSHDGGHKHGMMHGNTAR